jgi:hypothetical protein
LPKLAADLVPKKVDVIFAQSSTAVEPARQATKMIPSVFAFHADPRGDQACGKLALSTTLERNPEAPLFMIQLGLLLRAETMLGASLLCCKD